MRKKRNLVTPSLLDHYYLEGIGRVSKLKEVFSKNFGKRTNKTRPALLLDLGGRESPYEQLAQGLPVKWISVDIKKYGRTDVMLEGQRLPFQSGVFDAVLCTQVLGYVSDIFAVTHEIHRILKPHGVAFLSESAIFPPYGEGARWRILPEGWISCKAWAILLPYSSFFLKTASSSSFSRLEEAQPTKRAADKAERLRRVSDRFIKGLIFGVKGVDLPDTRIDGLAR